MVEYRGDRSERERNQYGERWGANRPNDDELGAKGEHRFNRVMTNGGTAVHVEVAVVDLVVAPKEARVKQAVDRVGSQIQHQHGERAAEPCRQRQVIEQPPTTLLRQDCKRKCCNRQAKPGQEKSNSGQRDIVEPSSTRPSCEMTARLK